jgi:SAM-dependent methyltransferase
MLFVELALIRWLGSNVLHLSYFSNFVLLGSFLGIGLGFLLSRGRRSVAFVSPLLLGGLVAYVLLQPVEVRRGGADAIFFTTIQENTGAPIWIVLPIVFVVVAAILAGPAEIVGRCFAKMRPLDAYRLDLLGSLAGILAFTGLAFASAPPLVWGAVAAIVYLLLLAHSRIAIAGCALFVLFLGLETFSADLRWSPYSKLEVTSYEDGHFLVRANGVPHQEIRAAAERVRLEPIYAASYELLERDRPGRVLIIGAGNGSDVAIALQRGATHVDAVEIDPRLLELGRELHPDRPYADPRVRTIVNDGRAFLEGTDRRYDLILYALPDSLVLVTGGGAVRLESYLFTREGIEAARARLAPGGGFAMYNYFREDWLVDRYARTVAEAFGHAPCVDRVRSANISLGQAVIAATLDRGDQRCEAAATTSSADEPSRDDRPFPYFRGGSIPSLYLFALAGILLVSLIAVRAIGGPLGTMRGYADLFFMGAAFLLLETKSVTTMALLFGSTWVVNAVVFAGVILAVLAAVEMTRRYRTPPLAWLFAGILVSLAVAYAVPNGAVLGLSLPLRLAAATMLAFTPIFLANIAFAKRFSETADSRSAFGVNILGAMVGGCLEYVALLTGYRHLLLIVAALYLAAFLLCPGAHRGVLVARLRPALGRG